MTYDEFLRNKIAIAQESGFTVELSEINSILKPHQKNAPTLFDLDDFKIAK